ncbi:MAG: hypothetical protein C4337_10410 [Armatimonadota bacterium]
MQVPVGQRFALTMFLLVLLLLLPYQWLSLHYFKEAMRTQQSLTVQVQLKTAQALLDQDTEALLRSCEDYSVWEEFRDAISKRDLRWIRVNVVDWVSRHFYLDVVAVFDMQGRVVLSTPVLPRPMEDPSYPVFRKALKGTSGVAFIRVGYRIYQVAYAPVLGESYSPPQSGVLLMAKRLDDARLMQIWGHLGTRVELLIQSPRRNDPNQLRLPTRLSDADDAQGAMLPIYDASRQPIGYLRVALMQEQVAHLHRSLRSAQRYLLLAGLAVTLVSSLVMIGLLRRHLHMFAVAVSQLANGNWSVRVPYPARDEFGLLARAFNQMADQLQNAFEKQSAQRQEIEQQKEELEQLYQQLQQANSELEHLNHELQEANRVLSTAANTDGLTGLKNHRAFHEALHSAVQMAERFGQPLSLIMLDVDHFKQFNDTYGHPTGDELLREVGAVLKRSARAYDVPARYGGEEFALILTNTGLNEAMQVAERLRQQIAEIQNPYAPITASLGVATYRHGTAPATLLYEADSALYQAKQSGRNQVRASSPEPPSEAA